MRSLLKVSLFLNCSPVNRARAQCPAQRACARARVLIPPPFLSQNRTVVGCHQPVLQGCSTLWPVAPGRRSRMLPALRLASPSLPRHQAARVSHTVMGPTPSLPPSLPPSPPPSLPTPCYACAQHVGARARRAHAHATPCAPRRRARSYPPSFHSQNRTVVGCHQPVLQVCSTLWPVAPGRRSRMPPALRLAAPSSPRHQAARVSHTVMGPTPSVRPSLPLSLHPAVHARSTLERAHGARARTLRPARRAGKVRSPPYPRPSLARAPSPPTDARAGRREERLRRRARAAEKAGKVRSPARPHSLHTHVRVHSPS